jgi:uncharacterized protein (DUF1330 family)
MPKGYVIFDEVINDQAGYDAYVGKALPTILQHGGRAIVVDGPETIEGEWFGNRVVVLEFDSVDAARAWYNSPEYQAAAPERHKAADCKAAIVSEFVMPGS